MMQGSPDVGGSPMTCSPSKRTMGSTKQSFNDLPPLPMTYDDGTFHHERDVGMSVDDFSERVHDQLPAVESYKATVNGQTSGSSFEATRRTYRRKLILVVAGSIAFVTLFLTIGVVIGRDEEESDSNSPFTAAYKPTTSDEDGYAPSTPTPTATTGTIDPNATQGRSPSRADSVAALVSTSDWSSLASTLDKLSPQYKAALWIADYDPLYLQIADTDEFRNRYALAVFYYATGGPKWSFNINWMTVHDVCSWNADWPGVSGNTVRVGVECDTNSKEMRNIFLPSMNLKGAIPPELGLLAGLQEIDLFNNDVIGTLPKEITKLSSMKGLIIHDNFLSGTVPTWLTQMPNLEIIDLARNSFHGDLPSTYGELTALTRLNLEFNALTGTLDPLANAKLLKYLSLGGNNITGSLSSDILTNWNVMVEFDLSNNKLAGDLPENLFEMEFLEILDLHGNQFEGNLPSAVRINPKLELLSLSENKLTGSISISIADLTQLRHLDLSWNQFEGSIPLELGALYDLTYLFLAFNPRLTPGPIPKEWDSLSELVDFSLQGTNRNGTIPGELGLLRQLVLLDLAGNQLTGPIPDDLGDLSMLTFLILKDNKLSGEIPTTLKKLTNLDTIVIDSNDLSGGASNICTSMEGTLGTFISDCQEIDCSSSCCTLCCTDADKNCNNLKWFSRK
jgi:Leucine-rich repeat (LRR) protein